MAETTYSWDEIANHNTARDLIDIAKSNEESNFATKLHSFSTKFCDTKRSPRWSASGSPCSRCKDISCQIPSSPRRQAVWVVIKGSVYDVSDFAEDHPGGIHYLLPRKVDIFNDTTLIGRVIRFHVRNDQRPSQSETEPEVSQTVLILEGSGKSSVAQALAKRLGWPMFDADDFHPPKNIEKMKRGEPLNDEDRAPWLTSLAEAISKHCEPEATGAVLTCSALKKVYRSVLLGSHSFPTVVFVFLEGKKDVISERMKARNHFMPPSLLDSQFNTLEEPQHDEHPIVCDITLSVPEIVDYVIAQSETICSQHKMVTNP